MPEGCLASQISAKAFNPLKHDLPYLLGLPPTVGDVTTFYLHLRNLGPRRSGEIGLILIPTGLIARPATRS